MTQVARRTYDKRVDMNVVRVGLLYVARNEVEDAIEALQALDVRAEVIEKDAGKRVARDLGERWVTWLLLCVTGSRLLPDELTDGDDKHSARAQV